MAASVVASPPWPGGVSVYDMTSAVMDPVDTRRVLAAQVDLCLTALGADLTAYIAGADSVEEFTSWFTGPALARPTVRRRVAAAAEVVTIFATYNRTALAAPWLREADEDGQVPASTLRHSIAIEPTVKALQSAAAAWVKHA
jgi:hypothetical protein